MKRTVAAAVLLALLVAAVGVAGAGSGQRAATRTVSSHRALELIAHHAPPDLVDLGEAGVTAGDQAVLSATLFWDYDDKQAIGTALVHCTVIAAAGPRHCVGTLVLPEGQIAVQGSYTEAGGPDELAVTGGTGRYAKVRGTVRLAELATGVVGVTVLRR